MAGPILNEVCAVRDEHVPIRARIIPQIMKTTLADTHMKRKKHSIQIIDNSTDNPTNTVAAWNAADGISENTRNEPVCVILTTWLLFTSVV